jgi:catechol 2,3-dioxygenase-like lactoylglutathione lyase family enzyme
MTVRRDVIEAKPASTDSGLKDPAAKPTTSVPKDDNARVGLRHAAPVKARCIDHVNLSVRDLDVSVDFYSRLLGIEVKERGGNGTRWCILGAPERFYVCFFEVPDGVFKQNDIHINHVGFVVDDIDETVRRIHGLGLRLEFNDAPLDWPRSKSAYVIDPDGILIEFTNQFGGGLD